jgi:hypothetical protein
VDAADAYRGAARDASEADLQWALGELQTRATGRPGFAACNAALQPPDDVPQGT